MLYNNPYNRIPSNCIPPMNSMIYSMKQGDVNGDGIPDIVYLTGIKTADSPLVQNITLVIQDGRTGIVNYVPLKMNIGYDPTLFLGDFTGDGVKDIFISIFSGGSGGMMFYYIYSYVGNMPRLLFDYDVFNNACEYQVIYRDYYKVEVVNLTKGLKYLIDISCSRDSDYLNEIYDRNGKLKEPIDGFVSPISGLYPIDFDTNGVYELQAYQRVSGRYSADAFGDLLTTLKWDGRMFAFSNQSLAIFGAEV